MKNLVAVLCLLIAAWSVHSQTNTTILSEVAVLTIHVSDTNTHDVVFHFLTDVLSLPVDYGPEMLGQRRYAAVYAGNIFIEPCGPFSNMRYPVKDFKALFFGLNCRSDNSPSSIAARLDRLKLAYEKLGTNVYRIQDPSIAEGVYLAVDAHALDNSAREKEASLASVMVANQREGLGLQYVKEIWVGYIGPGNLHAWQEFLGLKGRVSDTLWTLNKNQTIRFVRSEVPGVRAIVFKVRSLRQAEKLLKERKCFGRLVDGRIELDTAKTFGLVIQLEDR
jgi:hypothetical protein